MEEEKLKKDILNIKLIDKFREVVNSSPIFCSADELKVKWNLICVVMHRLDTSVKYLNKINSLYPESEEDFYNFYNFFLYGKRCNYKTA